MKKQICYRGLVVFCHSPEMLDIKGNCKKQIWYVYYSFKDSLKIINWCNNQMELITQRNQQAFPEGPANHMCVEFVGN